MQATGFVANELIVQLMQQGYTVRGAHTPKFCQTLLFLGICAFCTQCPRYFTGLTSNAPAAGTVRSPDSLQRATHLGKLAEAMQAALSLHPVDLLKPGSLDQVCKGASTDSCKSGACPFQACVVMLSAGGCCFDRWLLHQRPHKGCIIGILLASEVTW